MVQIVIMITFLCVAIGVYILATSQLDIASGKTVKATMQYRKNQVKVTKVDEWMHSLSVTLSPHIKMDAYKRKKLESDLKGLNITLSPEMYQAKALVRSLMILIGIVPCTLVFPIGSVGVIVVAVAFYFKSGNDIREQLQKKKEEISFELPRFANTLKQELVSSRDVLTILENYKKNAGNSMKDELDKTVADMRSGNYEAALLRFESRISIPTLSDIVRGLIGVLRGDNNVAYFEMLSHDLDILEIQRLESIAMKQPGKIKKYLFWLLMCLILMYITILGMYTLKMI